MLRAFWRIIWPQAIARWWTGLSVLLLALLFVVSKSAERVVIGRPWWHSFGTPDLITLGVLSLGVGAGSWYVHTGVQQALARAEQRQRQAEALAAENAAVVQVCRAIAHEFAQPLSGALAYSELLVARAGQLEATVRFEVGGLREGLLHQERLLVTLREALQSTPSPGGELHLAESVSRSVAAPRPRPPLALPPEEAPTGGGGEKAQSKERRRRHLRVL